MDRHIQNPQGILHSRKETEKMMARGKKKRKKEFRFKKKGNKFVELWNLKVCFTSKIKTVEMSAAVTKHININMYSCL